MSSAVVWFRQDLRLEDNLALVAALNAHEAVIPLYINDPSLAVVGAAQQWWLHRSLQALQRALQQHGLILIFRQGSALEHLMQLVHDHGVDAVYWNRCYEPVRIQHDQHIKQVLRENGVHATSFNGSLLQEPWQVKNQQGDWFKVFTPFWRKCCQQLNMPARAPLRIPLLNPVHAQSDDLNDWHLLPRNPNWSERFESLWQPGENGARAQLQLFIDTHLAQYAKARDMPADNVTSKLSPHLHFGEVSPGDVWRAVTEARMAVGSDQPALDRFLSQLGWREFSYYLLYHVPSLPEKAFKAQFDAFEWQDNANALACWQRGQTGYPIVDAGMRELWQTGTMHNRVRMVVASFLTKDLLIDWRLGAAWFWDTLLDADLANNSASWQWVAGCGADAAPYYRVFNPTLQGEKFDPNGHYVRRWVPQLQHLPNHLIHKPWLVPGAYCPPLVNHDDARKRALAYYAAIRQQRDV